MDHNNILPVVLAGGKAKRFGGNKPEAKLRDKILIDYILSEILKQFNEVLIVANEPINHLSSNKIFLACGSGIKPFLEYLFVGSAEAIFSNFLLIPFIFLKFFADNSW